MATDGNWLTLIATSGTWLTDRLTTGRRVTFSRSTDSGSISRTRSMRNDSISRGSTWLSSLMCTATGAIFSILSMLLISTGAIFWIAAIVTGGILSMLVISTLTSAMIALLLFGQSPGQM